MEWVVTIEGSGWVYQETRCSVMQINNMLQQKCN